MKSYIKIPTIIFILFITIFYFGCKHENHIDKHDVKLDSLRTLSDGFYGHRRGRIYFDNRKYMMWFTLGDAGEIMDIFKITDLAVQNANDTATIHKYNIDTTANRIMMDKFLILSRMYKFGHIYVDKANEISFSSNEDIKEEYVRTLNDSLKDSYLRNKNFRLLDNGWFEYQDN